MTQVLFLNTPWIYFMSLDLIIERLKHNQPEDSKVHWRNNSCTKGIGRYLGRPAGFLLCHRIPMWFYTGGYLLLLFQPPRLVHSTSQRFTQRKTFQAVNWDPHFPVHGRWVGLCEVLCPVPWQSSEPIHVVVYPSIQVYDCIFWAFSHAFHLNLGSSLAQGISLVINHGSMCKKPKT